ncbi:hypothetical protein TVAG_283070 [Trichomonas vaginalis G3]|uniref:Mon2/Sec7/BIG1-like HDS domain-containing protein n=1 Tax=Trichomonas vaginalis (strain ATCC PRA-98 / G3) TaxID=412133 RepID=A2DEL0_TRIV3|nr:protein of unknown function (DUF1981) family [Trichomonas vaginalis G3]EAY21137.1 hypothetical protein TVAG_283070 [Trichomonas vaginalis G3]KAI5522338.1 protein of unknown function (DUF1981) family [Trichomonas vaginalis G3]|eukprot:XP_001582123.1 hypothetical protein [Trichomonas vaginalis G3]
MNSQFNYQDVLHELSSKGYNEILSNSIVETSIMINIDQKLEIFDNSEIDKEKTEIAEMNIRRSIINEYYYPLITIFDGIYDICYDLLKKSLNFCSDFPKENLMYCQGSLMMLKAFLGLSSYANQFAKFEDFFSFSEILIQKYLKNGIKKVPNSIIKKLSKCFPTIRTSWNEYTKFILRNQIDFDLNFENLDSYSINLMIDAFDKEFYDENNKPRKIILKQILNIMLHAARSPDYIWKQVWNEIKQKVLIGIIHYKICLKFVELSIISSHNSGYNRQDELFEAYLTAYPDANDKQKTRIVDSISNVINSLKDQISSSWIYILQIVALDEMKDNQNCSSQALDILEKCVIDYSKQSRKYASYIITTISQILNTSNCIETRLRVVSLIPLVADNIINNVEEFEMLTDVLMTVFAEQEEIIVELGESYTYKIISSIIDKRDYVDVMMTKICQRSFSSEQGELINKLFKENKIPLYVNFNGYSIA